MSPPKAQPPPGTATDELVGLRRERDLYAQALMAMTSRYEQRIRDLSLLRRASEALRDCTDLDEVFRRLLGVVLEELPCTACSLYLADDSGELVLRARCDAGGQVEILRPGLPGGLRIAPGVGALGETFTTGEALLDPAVPDGTPGWFPDEARVLITAPLGPPVACLGVLALHEGEKQEVPEDAARLLSILATQATIAIENAALYQRLKHHSDTLEARVRERTAALEDLNAELQAATRQKSQFFAHFSHELRTPLNSILGFSELLLVQLHGTLTETQQRHARHIHESGQRLLRLINDILDLVKVEAGKLSLQVKPVALPSALEQALAVMHPQATAKHIHLSLAVPPDPPRVLADAGRLHQIMLNLLSNAVKFTPEGGHVTVTARRVDWSNSQMVNSCRPIDPLITRPVDGEGEWVEMSVTDTGIGIAVEDQGRLFRDFEQVAGAGRSRTGSGLGLSLTRRLVALHGGTIGLTSSPGQGSTFWFTLPIERGGPETGRQGRGDGGSRG